MFTRLARFVEEFGGVFVEFQLVKPPCFDAAHDHHGVWWLDDIRRVIRRGSVV